MGFIKIHQVIIGILVYTLLLAFLFKSCQTPEHTPVTGNTTFVVKPPTQYTDEGGTVHTETTVAQAVDIEGINNYYQGVIDSLVKVIRNKPKKSAVQGLVLIGTETNKEFKPIIDTSLADTSSGLIDSSNNLSDSTNTYKPVYTIIYKDKWLSLKGYIGIDSLWHHQSKDSIGIIPYFNRKHWYSSKELLLDLFSFNPNTVITGATAIKLNKIQPKKWGIGVMVGYGVGRDLQPQPFVGFGIQRNFIRF